MNTISFVTKSPLPYLSFDYPELWEITQSTGKGYSEITILGPRNIEDNFNFAVIIRFTPLIQGNAQLQKIAENYLERRKKLPGFLLRSQRTTRLEGIEAEVIEVGFLSPKSLDKPKPEMMKINEKRTIVINAGNLIEIIFTGTLNEYLFFLPDAEKIIESIKLITNC